MYINTKITSVATLLLAISLLVVTQNYAAATTYPSYPESETYEETANPEGETITGLTEESTPLITPLEEPSQSNTPEIFSRNSLDTNSSEPYVWNPGEDRSFFVLDDPLIDRDKSIVIPNISPVCDVGYVATGWFLLSCRDAPAEGTTLRYAVINSEPLPSPGLLQSDLAIDNKAKQNFENMTSDGASSNMTLSSADGATFR